MDKEYIDSINPLDAANDSFFELYIIEARGGNTAAAELLLALFTSQLKYYKVVHPQILMFVSTAFHEILMGKKPADALCLVRKKGRPVTQFSRDLDIAIKVRNLMDNGVDLLHATIEIADQYPPLSVDQVRNTYARLKDLAIQQIKAGIIITE